MNLHFIKVGLITLVVFSACTAYSQKQKETARKIKEAVWEHSPGEVAAKNDGYTMTAKIDGRNWTATYMMPDPDPTSNEKLVLGENSDLSISFYLYRRGLQVGTKRAFKDGNVADLRTNGDNGDAYGGRKGELVITKIDKQWIEGTFNFTANSSRSSKVIEVINGFFRVPIK